MTTIKINLGETQFGSTHQKEWHKVDITKLSEAALIHMLGNGIQRFINDAANGVKQDEDISDEDWSKAKFAKALEKVAQLEAETFTIHAKSTAVNEPANYFYIRQIMRDKKRKLVDFNAYAKLDSTRDKNDFLIAAWQEHDKRDVIEAHANKVMESDLATKALNATLTI